MASYELNNLGQRGPELTNYELATLKYEYQNVLTIEGYEVSNSAKSFARRYGHRSALDPYGTEETFKSVYERVIRKSRSLDGIDRDQAEARQRQNLQDAMNSAYQNQRDLVSAGAAIDYDALRRMQQGMMRDSSGPREELSMTGIILEFDKDLYDWIFHQAKDHNKNFSDIVCGILMHHKVNEEIDLEQDPIAKINAEIKQLKEDQMNVDK